jgi:hypothetical protein
MIQRTPQEQGRDYEHELAARYGGKAQPASGATPLFKLDWKLGNLLVSVKKTVHRSFRLTADDLLELRAGAQGPGSRGEIPCMVIGIEGAPDDVFLFFGSDVRAILEREVEVSFEPTKRAAKLAAANRR